LAGVIMKIEDILKSAGWVKDKITRKPYTYYYTKNTGTFYEHPVKNLKYYIQTKKLCLNDKEIAKFSTTQAQTEVSYDDINKLLIISGEIAIHVG